MTEEEINIAIAEACGRVRRPDGYWYAPGSKVTTSGIHNYARDLNAMHEAESQFIGNPEAAATYALYVLRAVGLDVKSEFEELNVDYCWHARNATARECAEAFLRTVGKWKEAA